MFGLSVSRTLPLLLVASFASNWDNVKVFEQHGEKIARDKLRREKKREWG